MRIPELFDKGGPVFSFEFFLPKPPQNMEQFFAAIGKLKELGPDFVTLTYGAGGSERSRTVEMAGRISKEIGLLSVCHLTCISHTKAEIREILAQIKSQGIENIVALRGDPPKDGALVPQEERELPYAKDLVETIRTENGFAVAVGGYPEVHPEAASAQEDLRRLKEKVDAGADWVITQLFFENAAYFDFVRRARAAGISIPIVPGIMPVTNFSQLKRFTNMCGVALPPKLLEDLKSIAEDREAVVQYGIDYALAQCRELLAGGAPGIHFYTLNKTRSTTRILSALKSG